MEVDVVGIHDGDADGVSTTVRVSFDIRCRRSDQSAIMTFEDPDGGLGAAAVLHPRALPLTPSTDQSTDQSTDESSPKLPIIVSMSGVGVTPQSQADAYKYKPNEHDKDYTFGYEDMVG